MGSEIQRTKNRNQKVGGHFYKYRVEYRYNKEKKRTDKITVGLLGKITESDGFVPSDKQLLREKAILTLQK